MVFLYSTWTPLSVPLSHHSLPKSTRIYIYVQQRVEKRFWTGLLCMNMPVPRDHDDYRTPDLMPTIVQTPPGMYTLQNRVFIIECTYHECLRSSSETQVCVLRAAGKRVGGGEGGVQQIAQSISRQSPVSVQCLYQKSIPVLIYGFLTQIHNIII